MARMIGNDRARSVTDIQGYDTVYRKLIRAVELFDVSSSFAMERIKYSTALPVDFA